MGTENEEQEVEQENEEVIAETKHELKNPEITVDHLKTLESRLEDRIQMLAKDRNKDAEDSASLRGELESVKQMLQEMKDAQEERERKHNNETTIVVPPPDLNPPTHQNKVEDAQPENAPKSNRKRRLPWY